MCLHVFRNYKKKGFFTLVYSLRKNNICSMFKSQQSLKKYKQ